jgi:uncharacterized repeat protein (TIGR01451 family)
MERISTARRAVGRFFVASVAALLVAQALGSLALAAPKSDAPNVFVVVAPSGQSSALTYTRYASSLDCSTGVAPSKTVTVGGTAFGIDVGPRSSVRFEAAERSAAGIPFRDWAGPGIATTGRSICIPGSAAIRTFTATYERFPVILDWAAPAPIRYGTPLGSGQLNAAVTFLGVPVAGSFTYEPAAGTVLGAGEHTLAVSFVPDDPLTYASRSGTVPLVVELAPLTVTAQDASRVEGEPNPPFSAAFDGFVAGDDATDLAGTLAFDTDATESSPPGTYAITPSGITSQNYDVDFVPGTLTVVSRLNLTVDLVDGTDPVDAGTTQTWTATITNAGGAPAAIAAGTVVLRMELPTGLSNVVATAPPGFSCSALIGDAIECSAVAATTLVPTQTLQFSLSAIVPGAPGEILVTAGVDPNNSIAEGSETDNADSETTAVQPPDLSVAVTVSAPTVAPGGSVTWTSTLANHGPAIAVIPAGTVVLRLTLPAGTTNVVATPPAGFGCSVSASDVLDCAATAATTIPVGTSLQFSVTANAPRSAGAATLAALADPLEVLAEGDETNNAGGATTTVDDGPNLTMSLVGASATVDARFSTSWLATITNAGTQPVNLASGNTIIRFLLPEGLANLAVSTPSGYTCYIAAVNTVDCDAVVAMTIPVDGTVGITFFGTAPATPGPISITATADPLEVIPEADETDNSDTETTTVQPPDFSITLADAADPVDARHSVTWTATITNDGPAVARISTGTRMIRFSLPAGLTNLAVSSPGSYTCFLENATTVDCQATTTSTLAVGGTLAFSFFATSPAAPGDIDLTATADPLEVIPEADETDNSDTETTTVQPPDFSITLADAADPVAPSASTSWTATITNDGPAVARISNSTVMIRFDIPSGLTNLAVSSPANYTCVLAATAVVECTTTATSSLAVGATLEFRFFATVPATAGTISLTATADPLGVVPEADEADNSDTETTSVGP